MNEPTFSVTPSFISELITLSADLNSEEDIIRTYEKIADLKSKKLDKDHAKAISDDRKTRELIFDDIPDKLRPLAEDLWALIEVMSEDETPEEKTEI